MFLKTEVDCLTVRKREKQYQLASFISTFLIPVFCKASKALYEISHITVIETTVNIFKIV